MNLPVVFDRYRSAIDAELRSALAPFSLPMYDMLRYHLGWLDAEGKPRSGPAGKALRPTLCLLACESVGGDWRRALPAAAAIELVHNFSLIHDDVQDDDRERRHRPTVWSIWGKPQAINAGTAMRVIASLTILHLHERGVPLARQLQGQRLLDESCLHLLEGQFLDISYESRPDVGVGDYLVMVEGKTAALISCSLEMGALLGSEDERVIRACRDYGKNVGFAFQIRDDVLGIWGDQGKTGKPIGGDIRRRKKSLPVVYGFEKATGEAKAKLREIYQAQSVDDVAVATALNILLDVRAQEAAQGLAETYRDKALAAIGEVALAPGARDNLAEIAHFATEREF